jgi:hypothetical protein
MAKLINAERSAENLTRAVDIMVTHKGSKLDAINAASESLSKAGYDMNDPKTTAKLMSFSAGDNQQTEGFIGTTRYDLSSQLIRDYMPEVSLENNPISDILPSETINGAVYQQNKYGSGYGMSQPAGAVMGVNNQVPLLTRNGKKYRGYEFTEFLELDGDAALAMSNISSSNLTENGATELVNLSTLVLINRQNTGILARSIDAIKSGSFIATKTGTAVSSQLSSNNIFTVAGGLTAGSYNTTTNLFTPNYAYTADPIQQLMAFINRLVNTGVIVESVMMDNQMYLWMFGTTAVKNRTVYSSAVSSNNMAQVQDNVFRINSIPQMMGIPIDVYSQGYKFAEGETDLTNTRPLWWGEEVTPSSFRVMIKTKSPNGSIMGNLGFFPNIYKDGMFSSNTATGIVVRAQDSSAYNMLDQRYTVLASSTYCPMVYQPNLIYLFDFNVTVV